MGNITNTCSILDFRREGSSSKKNSYFNKHELAVIYSLFESMNIEGALMCQDSFLLLWTKAEAMRYINAW